MDYQQLETWARQGESEILEFKRTSGERKEAARTLCAMLNHRGGRIVLGIDDDGRIIGQDVSDRTMEHLAQEIKEIDPPAFPSIERLEVGEGREALVLSVTQGQSRPYSYKGKAYFRVGTTSPEMSRDAYHRMLLERFHGEYRWENQPAEKWTIADLDVGEIVRTLEEAVRRGRGEEPGTRDPEAILQAFGLLQDGKLLRAAVVLFGRAERLMGEFPQCLLRVARFRGVDKSEFLDNRQFHGNAFELLFRAERFLRESLPIAGRVLPGSFERVDDPLYPPAALREALANAVCHRDYSIGGGSIGVAVYDDRLEITSSGILHFGLTAEALFKPHESLRWNPLIAHAFFRRGVIESWGRGTLKMLELTQRAGLPRPIIEERGGCVSVEFRPSHYLPPQRVAHDLTDRQQVILAALGTSREGLPLREIKARIYPPAEEWEVKGDLAVLKALHLVCTVGRGRGASWALFGGKQA